MCDVLKLSFSKSTSVYFGVEILLSKGISTNPLELTQEEIANISSYKEPSKNLKEESKDFSAKLSAVPPTNLRVQFEDSTNKLVKDLNKVKNPQELQNQLLQRSRHLSHLVILNPLSNLRRLNSNEVCDSTPSEVSQTNKYALTHKSHD